MKLHDVFLSLALISYFCIVVNGDMAGIPFLFFLIYALFDLWTMTEIGAFLGIGGLVLLFLMRNKKDPVRIFIAEVVAGILLMAPILIRIKSLPAHLFLYTGFLLPLVLFLLFYGLTLIVSMLAIRKPEIAQ
jgi:hypothetical protein